MKEPTICDVYCSGSKHMCRLHFGECPYDHDPEANAKLDILKRLSSEPMRKMIEHAREQSEKIMKEIKESIQMDPEDMRKPFNI